MSCRIRTISTIAFAAVSCAMAGAQATFDSIDAHSILVDGNHLFVTGTQSGVAVFNAENHRLEAEWPTDAPVKTIKTLGGRVCWALKDSRTIWSAEIGQKEPNQFDVPGYMITGAVERLDQWNGKIMAEGESGFAFVDPVSGDIKSGSSVFPADVYETARQGIVQAQWSNGTGLLISIRRYGTRSRSSIDETSDIGMLTAWSGSSDGQMQLLGGYTCSLVNFREGQGPDVVVTKGRNTVRMPFGTGEIGNVCIGPEGIVALGGREVVAVPFFQNNWMPNRFKSGFPARRAQDACFYQESVWWSDLGAVYRTDLSDGSSEAYAPKDRNFQIRSIACDAEGTWLATDHGIRRLSFSNYKSDWARVSVSANSDATTHQQHVLLDTIRRIGNGARGNEATLAGIMSGCGAKLTGDLSCGQAKSAAEAEVGDVIVDGSSRGIYMGAGQVLTSQEGVLGTKDLKPTADMQVYRVLPRSPLTAEDLAIPAPRPAVAQPIIRPNDSYRAPAYVPSRSRRRDVIDPLPPVTTRGQAPQARVGDAYGAICPVGVNQPKSELGTSQYVFADPTSSCDHPYLPSHSRLLAEAQSWIGTPYRWGGNTKDGVDCSGFVKAVFEAVGIRLPRCSQDMGQARFGKVVQSGPLHFGDILVFQYPKHVALYIGDGRTIEAVSGGVSYSRISRRDQAIVRRFLD